MLGNPVFLNICCLVAETGVQSGHFSVLLQHGVRLALGEAAKPGPSGAWRQCLGGGRAETSGKVVRGGQRCEVWGSCLLLVF
jgi:hypothetical protein